MKKCTMLIAFLCAFAGIGTYAQESGSKPAGVLVKGRVLDEKGDPLNDAGVRLTQTSTGTHTDKEGNFQLKVPASAKSITVSFAGYATQDIALTGKSEYTIRLQVADKSMEDLVVTGVFVRKKESFTGAIASFKGDQLKSVGNQDVIQSLKTLDPSFIIVENTLAGSNPNSPPTIEVRGKTSISTSTVKDQFAADPNQPLFILDGFETTLQVIRDLDMNKIASATILKDAASTAIYGAKAANGVVVIETKKPLPGEVRITYTGDYQVQIPDLSSYNMMNATEKLEFERRTGKFTSNNWYTEDGMKKQESLNMLYNDRLAEVRRGVNTYWLSEPLHTGFTHGHSLQVSGGSNELLFVAGLNYKNISGAMKGSGRKAWGGNLDLTYRKGRLNISNRLYLSGYKANESPYGSFSNFVNTNPYYRKHNAEGGIDKTFEVNIGNAANEILDLKAYNPLYDALQGRRQEDVNFSVTNNLQMIWTINTDLRLQGGLQVNKGITVGELFIPPSSSYFSEKPILERGSYANNRANRSGYQGNIMLTYAKVFQRKHQITGNLRSEIQETINSSNGYDAIGFPMGSNGDASFTYGYKPYSRPRSYISEFRRNNFLASANYAYDQRYMLDATYRIDGSTAFGSNEKYTSFWAVGVGWNMHKEDFMQDITWLNMLKIRSNIGITGNQDLGSTASTSVYTYVPGSNIGGQGLVLSTMANKNLKWQKTLQTSIGAEIAVFKNRVSATVNAFQKKTDPLVINVDMTSSSGIKNYPVNAGYMTTNGVEVNLKVAPIYNLEERIIWTVSAFGSAMKSTLGGINKQLESVNEQLRDSYKNQNPTPSEGGLDKQQQISNALLRFQDGYSPDDIWAVQSMGIDPASGREIFLQPNGLTTFNYNVNDAVRVANKRPVMEGVLSTNFVYKALSAGVNLRYSWGAEHFNSALFNKVENITYAGLNNNQDKRALYDRWEKPGDIAQFRNISYTSAIGTPASTPISSRFVQKNNYLSGESINIGCEFTSNNYGWVKRMKMQSLRVNAYMNDFFRTSTIKAERGIDYPFTRSVSMSLNVTF